MTLQLLQPVCIWRSSQTIANRQYASIRCIKQVLVHIACICTVQIHVVVCDWPASLPYIAGLACLAGFARCHCYVTQAFLNSSISNTNHNTFCYGTQRTQTYTTYTLSKPQLQSDWTGVMCVLINAHPPCMSTASRMVWRSVLSSIVTDRTSSTMTASKRSAHPLLICTYMYMYMLLFHSSYTIYEYVSRCMYMYIHCTCMHIQHDIVHALYIVSWVSVRGCLLVAYNVQCTVSASWRHLQAYTKCVHFVWKLGYCT